MFPKFSVKKPLTIFVVAVAVVVLGVVAYIKMTPDLMPNMDFPYVIVVTSDPGASPESIEKEITRPIEEAMATLDHIKTITSTSQNSVSTVVLEFENGTDMNTLSIDMQQKLTALQGDWDDTVSTPYMLKINPSMLPVMVAAISYEGMEVEELSDFVNDELEQKLTGISGVASVDISGTLARQMHVILDEAKLDKVSAEMLVEAEKLLDDAEKTLKDARKQVVEAQEKIADAKEEMADSAAGEISGAAGSASDMLDEVQKFDPTNPPEAENPPEYGTDEFKALPKEEQIALLVAECDRLQTSIDANNESIAEYKRAQDLTDADFNKMDEEITKQQIVVNDLRADVLQQEQGLPDSSAEGYDEAVAKLQISQEQLSAEEATLSQLQRERTTLQAMKTSAPNEIPRLEQENSGLKYRLAEKKAILKDEYKYDYDKEKEQNEKDAEDAMEDLDDLLDDLSNKAYISDMLVGAMDGMQQLTEAEIRLNDALTQIDQGLETIKTERKNLKDTLDVGGMLTVRLGVPGCFQW